MHGSQVIAETYIRVHTVLCDLCMNRTSVLRLTVYGHNLCTVLCTLCWIRTSITPETYIRVQNCTLVFMHDSYIYAETYRRVHSVLNVHTQTQGGPEGHVPPPPPKRP